MDQNAAGGAVLSIDDMPARAHVPFEEIETDAVRPATSFREALSELDRAECRAVVQPRPDFEFQDEIERFNRTGGRVYVVLGEPMADFERLFSQELEKKGMTDGRVREAFVEYCGRLMREYIATRGLEEGRFDITITSTFFERTQQEEWHIDNFDDSGRRYQLVTTLAGQPGTLIALPGQYDEPTFRRLRRERRALEQEQQRAAGGPLPFRKMAEKIRAAECRVARARNVRAMEEAFSDISGVQTPAGPMLIFKGGELPHTSAVTPHRRLIMTLVEFDEFMDTSQVRKM